MRQILLFSLLLGFSTSSFAAKRPQALAGVDAVYGTDDREYVTSSSPKEIQELAKSTAILVSSDLVDQGLLFTKIKAMPIQKNFSFCPNERFSEALFTAACTGFLVAPDLLVTAGHCIQGDLDCFGKKIIFEVSSKNQSKDGYRVYSKNVFSCKEIVAQNANNDEDYALIRLERKASGRKSLRLNTKGKITDDSKVFMLGHPLGMPLIYSKSVGITKNDNENLFQVPLDSFEGNSGSPVFNAKTLEVEGILVNGQSDLFFDSQKGCYRNTVYDEERGAEGVFRIEKLLPFL